MAAAYSHQHPPPQGQTQDWSLANQKIRRERLEKDHFMTIFRKEGHMRGSAAPADFFLKSK